MLLQSRKFKIRNRKVDPDHMEGEKFFNTESGGMDVINADLMGFDPNNSENWNPEGDFFKGNIDYLLFTKTIERYFVGTYQYRNTDLAFKDKIEKLLFWNGKAVLFQLLGEKYVSNYTFDIKDLDRNDVPTKVKILAPGKNYDKLELTAGEFVVIKNNFEGLHTLIYSYKRIWSILRNLNDLDNHSFLTQDKAFVGMAGSDQKWKDFFIQLKSKSPLIPLKTTDLKDLDIQEIKFEDKSAQKINIFVFQLNFLLKTLSLETTDFTNKRERKTEEEVEREDIFGSSLITEGRNQRAYALKKANILWGWTNELI